MFNRNTNQWEFRENLVPTNISNNALYGKNVSINEDKIAVGCERCNSYKGAVYIYNYNKYTIIS